MDEKLFKEWLHWIEVVKDNGAEREAIEDALLYHNLELSAFEDHLTGLFGVRESDGPVLWMDQDSVIANLEAKGARKFATDKAEVYTVDRFMTAHECRQMVTLIKSALRPSTVLGRSSDKDFRTSSSCDLNTIADPFRQKIDTRISELLGVDDRLSEKMQGQHYEVGQEFKPHFDYFHSNQIISQSFGKGQRSWTVMVYLNSTKKGGETVFTELPKAFSPKMGMALVWNNLTTERLVNPNTMHHATPVKAGTKTIITKWFRSYVSPTAEKLARKPSTR